MKSFKSFLAPQIQEFIAYRQNLGYQIRHSKSHLKTFDQYLKDQKIEKSLLPPSFFLQLRSDLKIEPRSVNAIISSLRVFFQFLIRKGIYAQNPLQDNKTRMRAGKFPLPPEMDYSKWEQNQKSGHPAPECEGKRRNFRVHSPADDEITRPEQRR